jgi:hypothetical protein
MGLAPIDLSVRAWSEAEELANFVDISGVVVSKLDRVTENGQRLVRVRLVSGVDRVSRNQLANLERISTEDKPSWVAAFVRRGVRYSCDSANAQNLEPL